jgi:hypothetical protein
MAKIRNLYNDMHTYGQTITANLNTATTTTTTTANPYTTITIAGNQYQPHWDTQPLYTPPPAYTTYDDIWNQPFGGNSFVGYNQEIFHKFLCYASSEGRIREGKKEVIFRLLETTTLDYDGIVRHLAIEEMLFNTLLMEYALQYVPKKYMELVARNSQFTKYELYAHVIVVYK